MAKKGSNWTPPGKPAKGLTTLAQRAKALANRRAAFDKTSEDLAARLYRGDISWATWEKYMRREVRAMHTAATIYARGGDPKAITPDDLKGLERTIRDQYKYLKNFSLQARARAFLVETGKGDFFSEKYVATRSKLYGGAPTATFYRMFCYDLLPQIPRDGQTQCKVNCKCYLEFKQGGNPEEIHVFWRLTPAEHCPDCLALTAKWNPYVLKLPEGLSASDWVTWLPRMRVHEDEPIAAFDPGQPRDEFGRWSDTGGSGETRGILAGTKPFIAAGIADVQARGIQTGNESAVCCDESGNKIDGTIDGQKDQADIKELITGKEFAFIHNHPSSSSFSSGDIAVFINSNMKHMVVAGHDGTVYIMSKPKNFRKVAGTSVYVRIWDNLVSKHQTEFEPDVLSGKVSAEAAWREQSHVAMKDFAKYTHLYYRRIG